MLRMASLLSLMLLCAALTPAFAATVGYVHGEVSKEGLIRYTVDDNGDRIENPEWIAQDPSPFHQMLLTSTNDTGTSQFRDIITGAGHTVEQLRDVDFEMAPGSLTSPAKKQLQDYDILIFSLHQRVWSAADAAALASWVAAGGTMLIYSDGATSGRFDLIEDESHGQTTVNSLISQFGMQVLMDNYGGNRHWRAEAGTVDADTPIMFDRPVIMGEGISPVGVDPAVTDIEILLPLNNDTEIYAQKAGTPAYFEMPGNVEGVTPGIDWQWACLAYRPFGEGKIVALFDRQPIWNKNINDEDNKVIVERIIEFLGTDSPGGSEEIEAKLAPIPATISVGEAVTFDGSVSQPSAGESLTWYRFYYDWQNDSYQQYNGTNSYTHTYDTPGTYEVRLRVWDSGPSSAITAIQTIVVTDDAPAELEAVLELSPMTVAVGQTVTFDGSGSQPSAGESLTWFRFYYNWEAKSYKQNRAEVGNSYDHIYTTPGTYQVALRVFETGSNNATSVIQTIEVTPEGGGGEAVLLQDTFVHKNKKNDNFGDKNVRVAQNSVWTSYLEYDIADFSGAQDALLSLYCTNDGFGQIEVFYNNTDSWDEMAMTYDSRISHSTGDKVGEVSGPYDVGETIDIPLEGVPMGGDTVTLILEIKGSGNATIFDSKETAPNVERIPALEVLPSGDG